MIVTLKLLPRLVAAALAVGVPATAIMVAAPSQALAQAGEDIDLEVFYRELQPYGEWFRHPRWGEVWRPNVDESWRPYTRGHWAWTEDYGWMWVAEEEWGWAAFHYGRWVFDDNEGAWIWIPGSQWAPAWVQWRESEEQVGWAPLPPDAYLDDGVMRFDASYYDNPRYARYWVFVAPRFMFEPGMYRYVAPISREAYFFRSTRPVSVNHQMYRGNVYLPGPDWRRVERWAGRPVPVISLRTVNTPRDQGWRHLGPNPSVLPIYRPRVSVAPDRTRAPLPNVGPRPGNTWPGRDGRPDFRPDQRPGSIGRPQQPDFRPAPGGNRPPPNRPSPQVDTRPSPGPGAGQGPGQGPGSGPSPWFPPNRGQQQPQVNRPGPGAGPGPGQMTQPPQGNRPAPQQPPQATRPPQQQPAGPAPRPGGGQVERERPSNDGR